MQEAVRFGDVQTFRTLIRFRRGPVVGTAVVVRLDRKSGRHLAERLVGRLDSRIQIGLHGGSNGAPVPTPEYVDSSGEPAQDEPVRPAGAPDLAAIALGPGDLPEGIKCNPGEYTRTTPPRITFHRSFCTHGRRVGRTPLLSLTNEVSAFESEEAAEASFTMSARMAATRSARETSANVRSAR